MKNVNLTDELSSLPYHIISFVEFKWPDIWITFKSGSSIKATGPDRETYLEIQKEVIANMDEDCYAVVSDTPIASFKSTEYPDG